MKTLIPIFLIFAFQLSFSQEEEFSKNQLIVEFKEDIEVTERNFSDLSEELTRINDSLGLSHFERIGNKKRNKTYLLHFNQNVDVMSLVRIYLKTNLFDFVEPNFVVKGHEASMIIPNDALFQSRQWYHSNNGTFTFSPATVNADMDTDLAWDLTQGDPNLIVAVLDTGLKLDHPEFAGRVISGPDFVNMDAIPTDDHGHGTNVTGVALAKGNNGIGYAGMNWNSKVLVCKVLDNNNLGFYSNMINGIYYAVDNGAKVINLSAGGNAPSAALEAAIAYAANNNVAFVASVGNQNSSNIQYPARYSNVIAVGSTDSNDSRSIAFIGNVNTGSNFGPEIDFVAPGNYIFGLSHLSDTNYNIARGGTSQAAPQVSGLISLLLSVKPTLTISEVREVLEQSSEDLVGNPAEDTSGFDQYYGFGRINANNALTNSLLSNIDFDKTLQNIFISPNPIVNNSFSIAGLAKNTNYNIEIVSVDGKTIMKKENVAIDGILTFNDISLNAGFYIVTIYDRINNQFYSRKILKK
ncbi:S8 family peptidase [Flavobacterium sp.]|uniref:S8 family peptidase n=1 Tax=Flavobacterium sp. TaxID=239 RepID=UPI00261D7670|nr:S8 family peptidase [Flavobacterium sp.]